MAAKSLDKLLNCSEPGALGKVLRRASEMGRLTGLVVDSLPEVDADQIVAANLRDDGELVVVCRTSAWAARIRFDAPQLVGALVRAGYVVEGCTDRVSHADAAGSQA